MRIKGIEPPAKDPPKNITEARARIAAQKREAKSVNKQLRSMTRARISTGPTKPNKENRVMNDVIRGSIGTGSNAEPLDQEQTQEDTGKLTPQGSAGEGFNITNMPNKPESMNDALREVLDLRKQLAKARK